MSFPDKKTVEWAVHTFRPLMHGLDIKSLTSGVYHQITTFDDLYYQNMVKCHMDNCVIIVMRMRFSKTCYKGVFIWQYNKETQLFCLYIFLNDNLFVNPVIRKAVSTHEFTHCTAALMSVSELETEALIYNQMNKMKQSFHAFQDSDIQKLMNDIILSLFSKLPKIRQLLEFPDEHFRTGDENFQGSYTDLYSHLLFSYELFKQYFTDEMVLKLLNQTKSETNKDISSMVKKIAKEKCLMETFVKFRVMLFLQREKANITNLKHQ